jgi:hypothetical protein
MMAIKHIPFLKASRGLNVVADPVRIAYDPQSGVADLATAYNVDIDVSGRISRRKGFTLRGAWEARDIFCDGGECLFMSGTSLYRLNRDWTRTGVRSGMTLGAKLWCVQSGDRIYYANGVQRGYVVTGVSWNWDVTQYYGPPTSRVFQSPPDGITMLEIYKGIMYCVKDNIVWHSEPFSYHWFDYAKGFIPFTTNVRFIKASFGATDRESDGLYVGTDRGVEFLEGDEPGKFSREQVSDSPPIIGSAIRCDLSRIGKGTAGKGVMWAAQDGIWVGNANGQAQCVTKDKLKYPAALFGAGAYNNGKYIVLLQE